MRTDDLINMLASGDVRPQPLPLQRMALTLALGLLITIMLMASVLGVRSNLAQVLLMPAFWLKFIFVLTLAGIGWIATARLSRPGARAGKIIAILALPVLVMWSIAAIKLLAAEPAAREYLFWGDTWRVCSILIAVLSLPIFAAALHVMRALAPTRLRVAGAAAGLTSGAAAAAVYCLHCPEMAAPFVGFWYVLGILIPTTIGALIGPRVLRW